MPTPARSYPVRLVGTRSCRDAIGRARTGDAVQLLRETGNPFDAEFAEIGDGIDNDARGMWGVV